VGRLADALQHLQSEIVEIEPASDQPPGRLSDHHLVGPRQALQSRRQIGRLADHRLLLRRALANQIANHH
jgi:hypothetical protein